MELWQCTKCQYIFDPEIGDPENDIEEGTAFEDLPGSWVCPECGAKRSKFKPYEEEEEDNFDQDEER